MALSLEIKFGSKQSIRIQSMAWTRLYVVVDHEEH